MLTTNLETLKIHKLTKEQYERELAAGNIDANALYLTPEEDVDLSQYATKTEISEAQAALQLALDGKADSSHTHNYLPLSGGTLTGSVSFNANSGAWARGLVYKTKDGSSNLATIGALGDTDTLTYVYIGTSYVSANSPFKFYIADKKFNCTGTGTFTNGIHFGGESLTSYPYVYASGKTLYIRINNTYWSFDETGIKKNDITKVS